MKTEDLKNYIFEQLNETSDALKQKLIDARFEQGWTAAKGGDKLFHEYMGQDPETGKPGKKGEGYGNSALLGVRDIRRNEMKKAWASSDKAKNRLKGLRGDGSPRTPKQESAFNFINGLKRLNELTGVTDKLANKVLGKRRTQYVNKVRDIMSQDQGPGSLRAANGVEARMNRTQKLVNARQARKTGDAEKPVTGEEYREDYPTKSWSRPVRYGFGGPLS